MTKLFQMRFLLAIMGALVLALSLLFSNAPNPMPLTQTSTPDLEKIARTVVNFLSEAKFEEPCGLFNKEMAAAMPPEKLQEVWNDIIGKFGEFEEIAKTKLTEEAGYRMVYVTCKFAKTSLDLKVVFDKEAKIAGLWFFPAQSEATYKSPEYANPESFVEVEYVVGTGEWQLPATLLVPKGKGPFPAVVLVHGSGPHDRDETIGPNKPFKDLSWGLASRGIAVLCYEKRTKQYASKSANMMENFTVDDETVNDALAAVDLLRKVEEIRSDRIFILGHSLGGMLAPRIASQDEQLSGLILLAANTRSLPDMIIEQTEYLVSLDGEINAVEAEYLEEIKKQVKRIKKLDINEGEIVFGAARVYWADLMAYDPVKTARALALPMLIIQGGRDYQVTMKDFEGWKEGLAGKDRVDFKFYPDLNHLFNSGTGKSTPTEYEKAGNVAQIVIEDIAKWIKNQ